MVLIIMIPDVKGGLRHCPSWMMQLFTAATRTCFSPPPFFFVLFCTTIFRNIMTVLNINIQTVLLFRLGWYDYVPKYNDRLY